MVSAGTIALEITFNRIYSVMFDYHYSLSSDFYRHFGAWNRGRMGPSAYRAKIYLTAPVYLALTFSIQQKNSTTLYGFDLFGTVAGTFAALVLLKIGAVPFLLLTASVAVLPVMPPLLTLSSQEGPAAQLQYLTPAVGGSMFPIFVLKKQAFTPEKTDGIHRRIHFVRASTEAAFIPYINLSDMRKFQQGLYLMARGELFSEELRGYGD